MASRFSGNYPITLTGLLDQMNAIVATTITAETTEFDTQTVTEKFGRLKTIAIKLIEAINQNQAINKQTITDITDSVIAVANDLKGKVDALSNLTDEDLEKIQNTMEILSNINIDTIGDLIRGQASIMSLLNGMTNSVQIGRKNLNTIADGRIIIPLNDLAFVENDTYTLNATTNNANVLAYVNSNLSNHTQAVIELRDLRYDYIKGFDTTKEAINLDLILTHNNASAKAHLSNSVTTLGDITDEDSTNDTIEVAIPN